MMVEAERSIGPQVQAYQELLAPLVEVHNVIYKSPGILLQIVSWDSARERPVRLLEYVASRVPEFRIRHGIDSREAIEPVKRLGDLDDREITELLCARECLGTGVAMDDEYIRYKQSLREGIESDSLAGRLYVANSLGGLARFLTLLELGRIEITLDRILLEASQRSPSLDFPAFILQYSTPTSDYGYIDLSLKTAGISS